MNYIRLRKILNEATQSASPEELPGADSDAQNILRSLQTFHSTIDMHSSFDIT